MPQKNKHDPVAPELREGMQWTLAICRFFSVPIELLFRKLGTAGHRYYNWAFPGLFMPLLFGMVLAKPDAYGRVNPAPEMGWAFLGMGFLWVLHSASSRKNRGKCHSKCISATRFCKGTNAVVETAGGLGLALALAPYSEPLCSMFLFATLGNGVYLASIKARYRVEDDARSDAMFEGMEVSQRMQKQQRDW